jgi:hypothetical protein
MMALPFSGGSAVGLSATDAWRSAAVGDVEQRSKVGASFKRGHWQIQKGHPEWKGAGTHLPVLAPYAPKGTSPDLKGTKAKEAKPRR